MFKKCFNIKESKQEHELNWEVLLNYHQRYSKLVTAST